MIQLNEILQKFNVDSTISEYGNGHINDTYCTEKPRFILQKINVNVLVVIVVVVLVVVVNVIQILF